MREDSSSGGVTPKNNITTRNSARLTMNTHHVETEEEQTDFSETESYEENENNKENEDTCGSTSSLRRSTRRRQLRYGSYNQQWIFGGTGPTAPGYPQDRKIENGEQPIRRSERNLNSGIKIEGIASCEESDDLYSRVKRASSSRRKTKQTKFYESRRSETVEPVASRLRERKPQVKKEEDFNHAPSLHEYLRRSNRYKKRRRASSSSSSSSDEDKYQPKKRPNSNIIGQGEKGSFKAQQRQFLSDLQPIKVDPSVTFDSIGGLSDHINKLKEMTVFPLIYKEFFSSRGISVPRGIIFHGLPGTGKTLMARALANECLNVGGKKVSFFLRKGADILNRWVGESERQLKVLFEQAAAHQPSIIFFDEIDGLAPIRSSKSEQVHNSVVSTLLAELDGVNDRGDIIVIGATNRIDSIDPALRRPGRFDFEIPFFLPGKEARKEILKVHLRKMNESFENFENLIDELAEKTSGFSGADLKLLCSQASMQALRRCFPQIYNSKQKLLVDFGRVQVMREDWLSSLKAVRPIQRMMQKPLPPQLLPLLGRNINAIERKINAIFPLNTEVVEEPSLKRMLIHSDNPDVIEEFIIPGILHRFESVKIFRFGLQEISVLREEQSAAVSILTSAPLNYKEPSILYIPRLDNLLKMLSDVSKTILHSKLIASVTSPCLVIATSEDSFIEEFDAFFLEKEEIDNPTELERKAFFEGVFTQALIVKQDVKVEMEELPLAPMEKKILTEEELRKIEKKESSTLRELRIFLREVLAKLARDRSFVEFTKPVNLEEIPDYGEIITDPMDFETMMSKIDLGEYLSAEMFLNDINLIVRNALLYNPCTNDADRRLRHHAKQLRDRAEDLIDKEMDSDFEEICKEIIKSRKERDAVAVVNTARDTPPREAEEEELPTIIHSDSKRKRKKTGTYNLPGSKSFRNGKSRKKLDYMTPGGAPISSPSPAANTVSTPPKALLVYTSEMQRLLEKVTAVSNKMTVFDMLEVRYKLCVAVERHQKRVNKLHLITELQTIIDNI